jgi:hypothetical protein
MRWILQGARWSDSIAARERLKIWLKDVGEPIHGRSDSDFDAITADAMDI